MDQNEAKRAAAQAALELLPDAGIVGLGTGSTAKLFIEGVGRLVRSGRNLRGVPTSEASAQHAQALGIELLSDDGPWCIDVCVDGADEVSAKLDLIKGGGGCHTREKIINEASTKNVIIVDESKLSEHLGQKWAVPIEVLRFAHGATAQALTRFGEVRRRDKQGAPWMTDAGNYLYDLHAGVITDPAALELQLAALPGVVDTGLFVGRIDLVLVAGPAGVRRLPHV